MLSRHATILALLATTSLFSGCMATGPDDDDGLADGVAEADEGTEKAWAQTTFNHHRVAETDEITDYNAMTVAEVQAFLENNPYGWTSVLANYSSNGKSAAQGIVDAAHTYQINPLAILTRTQLEQSLIGKSTASSKALNYAMGCGCPDNKPCNPAYKGFDKQVSCMASKYRSYLDDMANGGTTIAGWGVGITKKTLDKYYITPENEATALMYTYTPWRYAQKAHGKIWALYTQYVGYTGPDPNQPTDPNDPGDPNGPVAPLDVIIDNNNTVNGENAEFSASSQWTSSSYASSKYNDSYVYRSTGNSSDVANFQVRLDEATTVVVEAWWTSGSNRSKSAPFVVYDANDNNLGVVTVNQQNNGGQWVTIGTFDMTAGWNRVALSRWTTPGKVVIADAVRVRAAE